MLWNCQINLQRTSDFVFVTVVTPFLGFAPGGIDSLGPLWLPLLDSKFSEFLWQFVDDDWVGEDDGGAEDEFVVFMGLDVVITCALVTLFVTVAIFPLELVPLGGTGILLLASAAVLALPVDIS